MLKINIISKAYKKASEENKRDSLLEAMDQITVDKLIEHGANPNLKNKKGLSVLEELLFFYDFSKIEMLLKSKKVDFSEDIFFKFFF